MFGLTILMTFNFSVSRVMMKLNKALEHCQQQTVNDCLASPELYLHVIPQCMSEYYGQLQQLQSSKKEAGPYYDDDFIDFRIG